MQGSCIRGSSEYRIVNARAYRAAGTRALSGSGVASHPICIGRVRDRVRATQLQ